MPDMTPPTDLSPDIQQRLDWLEQSNKDAAQRIDEFITLNHSLVLDLQNLGLRLLKMEGKMRLLMPEVENCPKCHRKVNPGPHGKCGVCSYVW